MHGNPASEDQRSSRHKLKLSLAPSMIVSDEPSKARYLQLVSELDELLLLVDEECLARISRNKNHQCTDPGQRANNSAPLKSKLESLQGALMMRKAEFKKRRQDSSLRSTEDRIVALRRKHDALVSEKRALDQESARLDSALSEFSDSPVVQDLQEEIHNERRHGSELRQAHTALEQQLRSKQRICANLREQISKRGSRNPQPTPQITTIEKEIELFTEESIQLQNEIKDLHQYCTFYSSSARFNIYIYVDTTSATTWSE